jgi:mRNA interferase MazF
MARTLSRGQVRWYRFQAPDKRRPVVILTRDAVLEYFREVTIAPVTSTVRGLPSEVVLGAADGLPRDCAVNLDHVQTVSQNHIGALIATLRSDRMSEVRAALIFALGF